MGQRTIKTARKAAEKTTKAMAFEFAKAQLMELANAPFKIRWAFCKSILFPKKLKVSAEEKERIQKVSHGRMKVEKSNAVNGKG